MEIDSKFTKIFRSDNLTKTKYDELLEFAQNLLSIKQTLSVEVNDNLFFFLDMKKMEFVTYMRKAHQNLIPSCFDKHVYDQIHDCYSNRTKAVKHLLKFESISYKKCLKYKRDTKKHKKGDFKKVENEIKSTPLSICLTYLARYGSENILDYIKEQYPNCDEKKQAFYQNILDKCEKFGFDRLMNLALMKRERILAKYRKPINFVSLTFSGRSRKTKIVDYNSRFGSVINSFVSLSGLGRETFEIPVKFCKDYHGNMKDFLKKENDYEYIISFDEKYKQVNVYICKDGKRFLPEVNENSLTVGEDVNCKHNLLALSNGKTYGYDEQLVTDFCHLSLQIDNLKEADENYKVGRKKQQILDTLRNKMIKNEQAVIAEMCKDLQASGVTHIVLEDLKDFKTKSYVKDKKNEDINFNRVIKFLRLSNIKNEVMHIAPHYGIAVSTVQSYYTSKACPVCGCIDDENRVSQEEFECINCGHSANADINAAINILNRVQEAVIREKLLKQLDNGAFKPKNLKKETVKKVLESYRSTPTGTCSPNGQGS